MFGVGIGRIVSGSDGAWRFGVMNTAVELVAVTQSAAGTSYNEQQFDATSLLLTPSFPGAGCGVG